MNASAERERRRSDDLAVALLAISLALMLCLGGWTIFNELGRARATREQIHTNYEQLIATQRVFSLMQDAETGARGYSLTGQDEFLEPYNQARRDLPAQLGDLQRLLAGEPGQLNRLQRIQTLARERLDLLELGIGVRRTKGIQGVADLSGTRRLRGKGAMDAIRGLVAEISREEASQIRRSLEDDRLRSRRTDNMVGALFGTLIFGALAAILLTRRYLVVRQNLLGQAEAEARRQRSVFDAAMDGIVILDDAGRIERANPAAQRLFSRRMGEVLGMRLIDLLEASSAHDIQTRLEQASVGALEARRQEATALHPDGAEFPIEISIAAIGAERNRNVFAFVRDISDRREVDRMKEEFVSTVSHELRTPLTSIAGSLGLIVGGATGPLPKKAARLISIAQSNSQRLVRLINDVLDIEKLESGKLPFEFATIDLGDVAIKSIEATRGYADQLGVDMTLEVARAAPVRGDVDRLVQVVTNLLSNAAKFSPRPGIVRVRVGWEGDTARLTVTDNGPGVPEAFRDRIFSRFAQADGSDARGKGGTGLGLYIAKEIAERHGGRLWFESPPEGGAVFRLDLPVLKQHVEVTAPGPRDRVLLVEDDPAAQALLIAILEDEGLEIDAAGTLAEARAHLNDAGRYGAIVLDLRLPDGDGMDLMREIRARRDIQGVPIVVVSADAARGADPSSRAFDVVEWMEKPVDPDRLAELVRGAVGNKGQGRAVILHVDDDRDIRELVATALSGVGEVLSAEGLFEARALLSTRMPDLVILDIELHDGSGLDLLSDINATSERPVPVVVFSAQDATDLGAQVAAVLVKSKTSLAGLVGTVRKMVPALGSPS